MKLRKIKNNNTGSGVPVVYFIMCIAIASIMILIFGNILSPFLQLLSSTDDSINPDYSAPRGYFLSFVMLLWPKGLMLGIMFGLIFCLLMTYQKIRYQQMG